MAVIKNNKTGMWEVRTYYKDLTGARKQKNKRGFAKKSEVYDYLNRNPRTIQVAIAPYPYVIPALSAYGEKYVRSEANGTSRDNLLNLPRV